MTEVQFLSDHAVKQICDLVMGLAVLWFVYKILGGSNE